MDILAALLFLVSCVMCYGFYSWFDRHASGRLAENEYVRRGPSPLFLCSPLRMTGNERQNGIE
jgi:hypothetical protein